MKRNIYDRIAKRVGQAALAPRGATDTQVEIFRETLFADLRHTPAAGAARDGARGLLGRLAASPCIIECYSDAPGLAELRACLEKHFAWWHQLDRAPARSAPFLWIVAARAPRTLLDGIPFTPAAGWPAGVYRLGADVLRVGLVVASELPRDRDTLLVRIMAGGPLLAPAVRELLELPVTEYERTVVEPVLLDLQHALEPKWTRQPDEEDFIMVMYRSWEDARREGRADLLRKLLVRKFGELAPEVEARLAAASPAELDRYGERVLFADSLDAVFA